MTSMLSTILYTMCLRVCSWRRCDDRHHCILVDVIASLLACYHLLGFFINFISKIHTVDCYIEIDNSNSND